MTDLAGGNVRREVAYGITSLTKKKAHRRRLLELNRGHWSIENKVHWVRDVTFDEDRSRVRTGKAPQVMAALRNLALNLFRAAKASNIAAAIRHCAQHPADTLRLLGLRPLA